MRARICSNLPDLFFVPVTVTSCRILPVAQARAGFAVVKDAPPDKFRCPGRTLRHRHLVHAGGEIFDLVRGFKTDVEDVNAAETEGKLHRFVAARCHCTLATNERRLKARGKGVDANFTN